MRREVILITGANGEMGHGLIKRIGQENRSMIVALDLNPLDECLQPYCDRFIQGNILDKMLLGRLIAEYEITSIFHLASLLSTKAEYNPESAHEINVEGTINLLRLGVELSQWQGKPVKFIYPSSIAVYGLPDLETKNNEGRIPENKWCRPITMYGCNKIYCEHLGRYYSRHYRQIAKDPIKNSIDFRCIRFPGLLSADTVPTGGTSDYGPEMLHYAAQNQPYECFVRESTKIPFMVIAGCHQGFVIARGSACQEFNPVKLQYHQLFSNCRGDSRSCSSSFSQRPDILFHPSSKAKNCG